MEIRVVQADLKSRSRAARSVDVQQVPVQHTHTKPKLINRVGSANEEEELKQRFEGTNKHVEVISYGGYELTHLERS